MIDDMDLRLHDYAASANCYKVRLLLAQLGRPYERVPVDIFGGDTLTDEFAAINPARSTPVLQIGDDAYLPESDAILVYLAEGTSFMPEDPVARAQTLRWLFFEQTGVMMTIGGLRFRLLTGRFPADSDAAKRRRREAQLALGVLEGHLARRDFFVADRYGIADIAIYGYTHVAGDAGIDLADFPAVLAWCERVAGQDGYMNDLEPYPANAMAGAGRSIYG
jgi:glutathione S-transferase